MGAHDDIIKYETKVYFNDTEENTIQVSFAKKKKKKKNMLSFRQLSK